VAPPRGGENSSGPKRDMSTVRCFSCGKTGHYVGQCPKKKKKQHDVSIVIAKEIEFYTQFVRKCVVMIPSQILSWNH
jgi:hypothetical protein